MKLQKNAAAAAVAVAMTHNANSGNMHIASIAHKSAIKCEFRVRNDQKNRRYRPRPLPTTPEKVVTSGYKIIKPAQVLKCMIVSSCENLP